jgi:ureidoglycolate lyase
MTELEPRPLTADGFVPFGDVIETAGREPRDMNYGMALRWPELARIETGADGQAVIGRVRSKRYPLPYRLQVVERHPLGSQAFLPLDETPFLVVVAEPGPPPPASALRLFVTSGHQGICYRPGVWHGLLLTPFAEMDFIVVDRAGPGDNCEEFRYSPEASPVVPALTPD